MRLSEFEKNTIVSLSKKHFGNASKVVLFGSRAIDSRKGGDIDLLIVPENYSSVEELLERKIKLLVDLELQLGEQKIDIIIQKKGDTRSIVKTAQEKGVSLC